MRFMLTFQIGLEERNAAVRDGTLGQTIESILNDIKPEAAYFADIDGSRGGYLVINGRALNSGYRGASLS